MKIGLKEIVLSAGIFFGAKFGLNAQDTINYDKINADTLNHDSVYVSQDLLNLYNNLMEDDSLDDHFEYFWTEPLNGSADKATLQLQEDEWVPPQEFPKRNCDFGIYLLKMANQE